MVQTFNLNTLARRLQQQQLSLLFLLAPVGFAAAV